MKNPLNNSGKIFRWYIWVPYSAAFVCTNTEQQYHQCETNTIDTWTQIQSISRYSDHGVRGTIDLSIFLGDQEPQPPVKSGHSSIWRSGQPIMPTSVKRQRTSIVYRRYLHRRYPFRPATASARRTEGLQG